MIGGLGTLLKDSSQSGGGRVGGVGMPGESITMTGGLPGVAAHPSVEEDEPPTW